MIKARLSGAAPSRAPSRETSARLERAATEPQRAAANKERNAIAAAAMARPPHAAARTVAPERKSSGE